MTPGLEVREDALLDGRVRLLQPAAGYRVAIDPVLLAAAVPADAGAPVLDLGCGVGGAALCLLARCPEAVVTGLELHAEPAALAAGNARLNGCSERFQVVRGDVLSPPLRGGFDHVMANPPHLPADRARAPATAGRLVANVEGAAKLANWVAAALALVRPRGGVTFIHRADRLDELLAALHARAGEIVVFPLWPAAGRDAKRVLVRARRDVRTPSRLAAGLVLHAAGGFTPEAEAVLRGGAGLTI